MSSLILPLSLTYRIKHGVHMSIEPARSHHALKHPSIICIPYVMGGGWELFIRIRMVTAPAADIVTLRTLPYLTLPYLKLVFTMPWYIILPYDTLSPVANGSLKHTNPQFSIGKTGVRSRIRCAVAGSCVLPVQGFSFILQIQGFKHCIPVFAIVLPVRGFSLKADR